MPFSIDRFMNARSAHSPTFAPDGESVAFIADITGVPQVWQVPIWGGWPQQRTFAPDRILSAHYAHHHPDLIYGMDLGGSENEQLYMLRGADSVPLAVNPAVMHTYGAISPDDRQIAYAANKRHPAYFDIWVANLDGSGAHPVYESDASNFVSDWSPDGTKLLLHRRNGSLDADLLLLDLATGRADLLTPHPAPVNYQSARFAPDGSSIFCSTDQGSQFLRVARLDLQSHEWAFLTDDVADIEEVVPGPQGDLVLTRNEAGYGRLLVLDPVTGAEVAAPDLPDGVAQQPVWSPDGRSIAFAFTDPRRNLNIWLWDRSEGNTRQITHVTNGGIPEAVLAEPELVTYTSFDDLEIPGLLYIPEEQEPPVVVYVHGGPESQSRPIYNPVVQYFVHQGYAVFLPNVRGSTGYGRTYTHLDDVERRMDSVADLEAGAQWLRNSNLVDPKRMAVMGGSYGGFMVLAALTTYPQTWAAGVDIVGIANLETFLRNTSAYRRHWRIPEYGDPVRDADFLRRISPIHHVDRIQAPLMVIHGDNDPRVPLDETLQMVDALTARGMPVELLRFDDEGHGVIKLKNKLLAYPAIAAFLDRYLSGKPEPAAIGR